tara:strand:- start:1171 stop:2004 length:834 start_codon:yes stop_codon:yes gene_type:complete
MAEPTKSSSKPEPILSSAGSTEIKALTPEYIYKTDPNVEDFNPIGRPKNDLNPPPSFVATKPPAPRPDPTRPQDKDYCLRNPEDPRCHDEQDVYQDLGLFAEEVKDIFDAEKRSKKIIEKPVQSLYESKKDDTQFDTPHIIRQECRCKDGTKALGFLNTKTGQRDCSACNPRTRKFSNPSIYKNYNTKKPRPDFSGKKVPLRKQIGVSNFGDVNLKGCPTGNANRNIEVTNQKATLNNVINIDTIDSIGGANITAEQNTTGLPISLYDGCSTNVYKI